MATTVLDSVLFRDSFGTPRMRAIFEGSAWSRATSRSKSPWRVRRAVAA